MELLALLFGGILFTLLAGGLVKVGEIITESRRPVAGDVVHSINAELSQCVHRFSRGIVVSRDGEYYRVAVPSEPSSSTYDQELVVHQCCIWRTEDK